MLKSFYFLFLIFSNLNVLKSDGTFKNPIRLPYGYLSGPFMGFFLAIALPLELENKNVFLSYNFEANYNLPSNETTFDYPPIVSDRSLGIDRKKVYDALEFKINSHDYPGKACLLRTICEATDLSFSRGVLDDIIHVLLTPTSSIDERALTDYLEAEQYGKLKKNCAKYNKKCPVSFISFITFLEKSF